MSPVEQSIEAQVTIDVEPELSINIREDHVTSIYLSDKIVPVYIDVSDLIQKVYIDLDNTTDADSDPGGVLFRIAMPIIFGKSVSGRKKTFGRTSLAITNVITTSGAIPIPTMPFPLGDTNDS